jgi:hypothetical protein
MKEATVGKGVKSKPTSGTYHWTAPPTISSWHLDNFRFGLEEGGIPLVDLEQRLKSDNTSQPKPTLLSRGPVWIGTYLPTMGIELDSSARRVSQMPKQSPTNLLFSTHLDTRLSKPHRSGVETETRWISAKKGKGPKTYNTRDSLVVTDPTTSLAVAGLSMGERTGSRILQCLWSYVSVPSVTVVQEGEIGALLRGCEADPF